MLVRDCLEGWHPVEMGGLRGWSGGGEERHVGGDEVGLQLIRCMDDGRNGFFHILKASCMWE